ncbi:hypothetical protein [Chamaesiphon sp. VAR_48_metabat_135_sub]|uniref:hypothetical protein n=1 Tax=Chamaesiphon sp. VAR_48_metabat_135_sub TaxID=2964699 RepID=UPI00286CB318|nr:hypothetical protein [Chamaesiphon sp. VAR_48_metabat_135_sub]
MLPFSTIRDRDAWSTIRGYVYQVDLTIQRWLDLTPNQILELECGEDIDIVGRALIADSEECSRLLEQVKHREDSITLKSSESVTAIACFVEHCLTNPTADLIFQFTTNTRIGKEKLSPLPNRIPAIEAWESLRLGKLEKENQDRVIAGIRQILENVKKPDDLHKDTWQQFRNFIQTATTEQFFDLISKFQWQTNAPEARSLTSLLQQQLLDRQHAIDSQQAQQQYQRLFWYVFTRLCKHGRKQLTLEELNVQLALPSLSSTDRETLKTLKSWFSEIDNRVTNLEQEQQQNSQLVNELSAEIQQIAKTQGIDGAFQYVVETSILDIPLLSERSSLRGETIQSLSQTFINHTWIAINGSLGSGKTQLAILLVNYSIDRGHCSGCKWFRLRDLTVEQACLRIDRAVESLVGYSSQGNLNQWYNELSDRLGANAILVFDDLPRLARGDELETRLTLLARVCDSKGIRLLSTSSHHLPQNLQSILGDRILHVTNVPAFTNDEASDLFNIYGAPESFFQIGRVAYLNALANHHPSLLAAISEYLHGQNWQFTSQEFEALLGGKYASDINEETLGRILAAIKDDQSQELLYRLNLISGSFSQEDVQVLADVSPSIERPKQRLHHLLGAWIQRDRSNYLLVSPLVKTLGSQDLSSSVRRKCYLTLGELIVNGEFNQYQAFNAVSYFARAEAFDKAGSLLLFALNGLELDKNKIDDGGLLLLWSQQPLPKQMDLGIRLLLRGVQISFSVKNRKSVSYLLNNLDSLIEDITIQEAGMAMATFAHLIISPYSDRIGFLRLNRYLQMALHFSSLVESSEKSKLSLLLDKIPFESLILMVGKNIQNIVELEDWIVTLEKLTSDQRDRAFSTELAEVACPIIVEKLWLLETDKSVNNRDWQSLLKAMDKLVESSLNLNLELLWASAIHAKIIIIAEYNKNLTEAIKVANLAIARSSDDPRVRFLLQECLGRQFVFVRRYDEAVNFLTQSLKQPTEAYPLSKFYVFLRLSQAIADREPKLSIYYAQEAVNLAQLSEDIPETELVKALGELAIAKWLATDDLSIVFEVWDRAGECLLKYRQDNNTWKDLFVVYGHITGYFTIVATTENSPEDLENGESYAIPARGMFLSQNSTRSDYYKSERDCYILTQLASFAGAVGNGERSINWAIRGIEMARASQQILPLTSLIPDIIPQLVLENNFAQVLDLSVEMAEIMIVLNLIETSDRDISEVGIDVREILNSQENKAWQQVENFTFIIGVIPIIFRIANLAIFQPELAKNQSIDLAVMCREISHVSCTQSLLKTTADIIDQIHLQQSTCTEFISQYQNTISADNILPIGKLITVLLQQDKSLKEALVVHSLIIEQVQNLTKSHPITYQKIILPYFYNYWKKALDQIMFRFNNPQLTASLINQTQELPSNQQVQIILDIIRKDLIV